jgi:hypothetical protein
VFASTSLWQHLLRGIVGIGLFVWAVQISGAMPVPSLGLGIAALIVLKGCPLCWLIGLFEVVQQSQRSMLPKNGDS